MKSQSGKTSREGACSGPRKSGCEFLDGEGALPLYRAQTERMLRRYFRLSLDIGRLPSILGGEVFRGVVSSTRMHTFEDFVIFVHDMERCMEKLDPASLETIAAWSSWTKRRRKRGNRWVFRGGR